MSYRQEETTVSRAALRDAIRDDLLVALKAKEITVDPSMDGIPALTIPAVNEALDEVFAVELPTPTDRHAEVRTTATITVHAVCPECGETARTIVYLSSQLVADSAGAELKVKATSKARAHVHGQAELPEEKVDQLTVGELLEGTETIEETVVETTTETIEEITTDGCPFAGCVRDIDHPGFHRDADGNKIGRVR